jgi:hypothetical protein
MPAAGGFPAVRGRRGTDPIRTAVQDWPAGYAPAVDEELRRLRRERAGGREVGAEFVRALARARLHGELVADHGTLTRAGGEVGALVEGAWATALGRLERQVMPTPIAAGSEDRRDGGGARHARRGAQEVALEAWRC